MSLSPLQKSLLLSVSVSSVLFGVSTVPLALFNSLPVEVQVRNQPVFEDEMNALAGPYLGVAGAVSAALGVGILGMSGWRSAASKTEHEQTARADLEKNLLACKAELERIKFSDARLQMEKLGDFLQPELAPLPNQQMIPAYQAPNAVPAQPYEVVQNHVQGLHYALGSAAAHGPANGGTAIHPQRHGGYAAVDAPQPHKPHLYTANAQVAEHLGASSVAKAAVPVASAANHASEQAPDKQIEAMLQQMHDLMVRVESLRAGNTNQMAA